MSTRTDGIEPEELGVFTNAILAIYGFVARAYASLRALFVGLPWWQKWLLGAAILGAANALLQIIQVLIRWRS